MKYFKKGRSGCGRRVEANLERMFHGGKSMISKLGCNQITKVDVKVWKCPKTRAKAHELISTACFLALYPTNFGVCPGSIFKEPFFGYLATSPKLSFREEAFAKTLYKMAN